ncbi:MAG: serine/threonine-protein kinase, partial [Burkholderiales bacterium]
MSEPELKTLGRYNIERTLGKGAMGVVYEGLDPKLNRRVAIKTILKSHLDPDTAKDYSMRFSREAQAVARLNHPHIVQVYDFAEEGDIAYLVMEFIRGKELKNFFDANERFDLKEAVRIMGELLDALEFAHNAGIIHRDIKPANVMLDAQARTKLTDFGVARVTDNDRTQAERTQAGTMVGTPAYMSPEQITGGSIDKRTDVFSAGIILYQFLTGEKPFTGGGAWTIAKKIIQEDPPLPSSLNNAVTPYFDAVVNKALSKNPDTRYQSAKDFGVALKRALQGQGEADDESD